MVLLVVVDGGVRGFGENCVDGVGMGRGDGWTDVDDAGVADEAVMIEKCQR